MTQRPNRVQKYGVFVAVVAGRRLAQDIAQAVSDPMPAKTLAAVVFDLDADDEDSVTARIGGPDLRKPEHESDFLAWTDRKQPTQPDIAAMDADECVSEVPKKPGIQLVQVRNHPHGILSPSGKSVEAFQQDLAEFSADVQRCHYATTRIVWVFDMPGKALSSLDEAILGMCDCVLLCNDPPETTRLVVEDVMHRRAMCALVVDANDVCQGPDYAGEPATAVVKRCLELLADLDGAPDARRPTVPPPRRAVLQQPPGPRARRQQDRS